MIIGIVHFLSAGKQLKIRGTPTFIIGTEIVRGYKNVEELQNIINKVKQIL